MVHFTVEKAEHLECSHLAHAFRHIRIGESEQHHKRQTSGERHNQRHDRAHKIELETVGHVRAAYGFHHRAVLFERLSIVGLRLVRAGKFGIHGIPGQRFRTLHVRFCRNGHLDPGFTRLFVRFGRNGQLRGVLSALFVRFTRNGHVGYEGFAEQLDIVGFADVHVRSDKIAIHRAHFRSGLHAVAVGQSHFASGGDAKRACRRLRHYHTIVVQLQRAFPADTGRAQYSGMHRLQRDHFAQVGQSLFRHCNQLNTFTADTATAVAAARIALPNSHITRFDTHVHRRRGTTVRRDFGAHFVRVRIARNHHKIVLVNVTILLDTKVGHGVIDG